MHMDNVTRPATGAYPLTASEIAIVNYFNANFEKIEVEINQMKRVLEQVRDEVRQQQKNKEDKT